ncbi:Protein kinase alk2 [Orbilia brochopaga]|uniref:Protein kinase alk2 n=1 Tax=Orbilia brochopaga TaxID=3140254 RepID=A0AAV9TZE0_9PEZI
MLATQFEDFLVGPPKYGPFKPLIGGHVFTHDGPAWAYYRGLLRPQFSRQYVTQLIGIESNLKELFKCIPTDGTAVDMQSLFFDLCMDTATQFLFGENTCALQCRLSLLEGRTPSKQELSGSAFTTAFNDCQSHVLTRYYLRKFYYMHNPKEFQDSIKVCHDYIDRYVQRAVKIHDENERKERSGEADNFIFLDKLAVVTKDPIVLRSSMLGVLVAGRDATAGLLAFMFLLLPRYPEAEKKLRQAIYTDFGEKYDKSRITFESLRNCKYLAWTIDETLRMYPNAPINTRVAARDTTLPVGGGPDGKSPIFVPKGTAVDYSVYAMHRRSDIFGPDANWFRPDRWGEMQLKGESTWSYLPFNGGPRICLGQQYTLVEVGYVTVRMFQEFKRIEMGEKTEFIKCLTGLITSVGGNGVQLKCYRE